LLGKLRATATGSKLSEATARHALSLSLLPAFSGLVASLDSDKDKAAWAAFLDPANPSPETTAPLGWLSGAAPAPHRTALLQAILVRVFRPERVLAALELFVSAVFGADFGWRALGSSLDLADALLDTRPATPILLCSEAGQDASAKVDALASTRSTGGVQTLLQVSMGSHEGYAEADKSIALAAKAGGWVLLRNVHLCPDWLGLLEKRLSSPGFAASAHEGFRLFLTSEMSPALPSALLRASEMLVSEASTGLKANMQRFLAAIPASRIERQPAERARLYGLLGWLHAVVQERLRYLPLGWTKKYEFSETDAACALDVVDQWVDELAATRAHINPAELPWQALRTLLSQSIYGGRVDVAFDQAALDSFIDSVFAGAASYEAGFAVVRDAASGKTVLALPDGLSRAAFESWVAALPDANTPTWLGLPLTAESQRQSAAGLRALSKLAVLQGEDEPLPLSAAGGGGDVGAVSGPASPVLLGARQRGLLATAERWLKLLPASASPSPSPSAPAQSAVERAIERELHAGAAALQLVREHLLALQHYCVGQAKATNLTRDLSQALARGRPPASWAALFALGPDVTAEAWVADLAARLAALTALAPIVAAPSGASGAKAKIAAVTGARFWVGGLFHPEAFVTATRQHAAQVRFLRWFVRLPRSRLVSTR